MPNHDLTTLDLVCVLMDTELRPLDFALLLEFERKISPESLARGADSARNRYPTTGCKVVDGRWVRLGAETCRSAFRAVPREREANDIDSFLRGRLNVATGPPIRQVLMGDGADGPGYLVTRIHHCAADLLSALGWIRHQLRVAAGLDGPCAVATESGPPALAHAPAGAKRNPDWYRCAPVWTRPSPASSERRWVTFTLAARGLSDLTSKSDGFTFNDVLTVAFLETLHWWNRVHDDGERKVGVWLPVNIRRDPFHGFGNASGRIRVRRTYADRLTLADKCRAVRSQIRVARERGEWVIPEQTFPTRALFRYGSRLVRGYLNRPWADMGSASFSHVQRWPGQTDPVFTDVRKVAVVGAMHRRHALMLAALTFHGRTRMTITYDPALLWRQDLAAIRDHYVSTVEAVARGS